MNRGGKIRGIGRENRPDHSRGHRPRALPEPVAGVLVMWNRHTKAPRVLLVEDAPFLRYAFGRLLRLHGYDVMEANDGQEALDRLSEFQPELVVTDLMMPVMDGVELIRRLRDDPETVGVPILAITADASRHSEELAREAGADDFIAKPVDLPSLLNRMKLIQR
jgi:CheY-like chemotaxis protein